MRAAFVWVNSILYTLDAMESTVRVLYSYCNYGGCTIDRLNKYCLQVNIAYNLTIYLLLESFAKCLWRKVATESTKRFIHVIVCLDNGARRLLAVVFVSG